MATSDISAQGDGAVVPPFNPFAVALPERFDFRQPENWKRWLTRWERYRVISGLSKQNAETQVNSFLYALGSEAEDALIAMRLPDEDARDYDKVTAAFDHYFVPRRNVIYERARFNQRSQLEHEPVESFVKDLHRLADSCEFGILKDELIRDRLVVGLQDRALSERLQLDADLTLEKAVNMARNSEAVKSQQEVVRRNASEKTDLDAVTTRGRERRFTHKRPPTKSTAGRDATQTSPDACRWCGDGRGHPRARCPAQGKSCNSCGKKGHFATVCRSSNAKDQEMRTRHGRRQARKGIVEEVFLGEVQLAPSSDPWFVVACMDGKEVKFKVDTGADVTAVPGAALPPHTRLQKPTKMLYGPGSSKVHTLGQVKVDIKWKGITTRQEVFVVEGLRQALLGRPAIRALNVLPELLSLEDRPGSGPVVSKYPGLFGSLGQMNVTYSIRLAPGAKPHAVAYPRRVPLPLLPGVQDEVCRMEELGVIRKVEHATEWCAPMVVVKKKDGKLRICVDYTELNKQIIRERVIMPTVEESLSRISGASVFSKLDANAGYWQAPLSSESSELTTFITPLGRYQFLRLPFGIATAPEFFQREMLHILEGLEGTTCHMDDILVYGKDVKEHDRRLDAVLQRLNDAGVTLNEKKCEFRKKRTLYLGHVLEAAGISADPEKTAAIRKLPAPESVTQLRAFFGMLNHLMKFLPGLAEMTKPLRDLLASDAAWTWGPQQQQAFDRLKEQLAKTPVLTYYDPQRPHTLSVDASSYGLGAVLLQEDTDGQRRPVAYASRALTSTEQRYAQVEKEALAITWACEKFRMYILGLPFHIETDHKPLVPIFSTKRIDDLTPRLQRMRLRTIEYDFSIGHVPGKQLYTADVLSRNPVGEAKTESMEAVLKDYEVLAIGSLPASNNMLTRIRRAQAEDRTLHRVMEYCTTKWPPTSELPPDVRQYASVTDELSVVDDLLLRSGRLVIPPTLRSQVLESLHTGHQGVSRCRARAREATWWPGINAHLRDHVQKCPTCQVHRRPGTEPLLQTPVPDRPWEVIGMDIFYANHRNYLVVVDYFSKFFELATLKRTTTADVVSKLTPMFARFGIPDVIRSDNGPQFVSQEFKRFLSEHDIKHVTSSPYYPQSNGQAERTVQTAKALMKKSPNIHQALLAHRSTPGQCGYSPAELLMGRKIKSNIPMHPENLVPKWDHLAPYRRRYQAMQEAQASTYNSRRRASQRQELPDDTAVRILAGAAAHGTVVGRGPTPRSYVVQTSEGATRRTSRHLQADPGPQHLGQTPVQHDAVSTREPEARGLKTRSGRTIRKPERYGID